jgi:hypothetical protein
MCQSKSSNIELVKRINYSIQKELDIKSILVMKKDVSMLKHILLTESEKKAFNLFFNEEC